MTVIRAPQVFANRRMAENVRESFQTVGELCIFIQMYHAFSEDADTEDGTDRDTRCPRCWDPFYKESSDMNCEVCGGTGLAANATSRGIKRYGWAWCVISDNKTGNEMERKYGEWLKDDREIQIEAGIEPEQHDYLMRVQEWSTDYRPLVLGTRFRLEDPYPYSVRSGNQYGQVINNTIGYMCRAQRIRNYQPVAVFDFPPTEPVPRFPR
jgi:hypothetical protein